MTLTLTFWPWKWCLSHCANFGLPRPLCSRLRPDVRDRQTSDRQTDVRYHQYYNQLAGHIDLIDRCGRFGYSLSDRSARLVWQTVGRSLGRTDRSVRRSYRVNAQLVHQHFYFFSVGPPKSECFANVRWASARVCVCIERFQIGVVSR